MVQMLLKLYQKNVRSMDAFHLNLRKVWFCCFDKICIFQKMWNNFINFNLFFLKLYVLILHDATYCFKWSFNGLVRLRALYGYKCVLFYMYPKHRLKSFTMLIFSYVLEVNWLNKPPIEKRPRICSYKAQNQI